MTGATHRVWIDGIAFWAPTLPGWDLARAALAGADVTRPTGARPATTLLGPNERRRAPETVLLAQAVAEAAALQAGAEIATLRSVFTSANGDPAVVDTLCRTLAGQPKQLSPIRFQQSVHNAASGCWAIASRSHAASSAIAAGDCSFAAGWLEAGSQCAADGQPVLLVGFDTAASGPLSSVNHSVGSLAVALVLASAVGPRSAWCVDWALEAGPCPRPAPASTAARPLAGNAMADALPLFEALAAGQATSLQLPLGPGSTLALRLQPLAESGTR